MNTTKTALCSGKKKKKKKTLEIFNVKTLIDLLKKDGCLSIYVKHRSNWSKLQIYCVWTELENAALTIIQCAA